MANDSVAAHRSRNVTSLLSHTAQKVHFNYAVYLMAQGWLGGTSRAVNLQTQQLYMHAGPWHV